MDTRRRRTSATGERSAFSRSEFLRVAGAAALGVVARVGSRGALALAGRHVLAAPSAVEVYPTGNFPADVDEVNAAINGGTGPSGTDYAGGGTVRLKAADSQGVPTAFNFGDGVYPVSRGTVTVQRDVVVLGERCASPATNLLIDPAPDARYPPDRTVIYGGKRPLSCSQATEAAIRLKVTGIYFAQPSLAAVQVGRSAGLEVTDCVVYDVKTDETDYPGFSVAVGIEATGLFQASPVLEGEFKVCDKRIFRSPPAPEEPPWSYFADTGIVLQMANMPGTIRGNEVEGFPFVGIGIDANTRHVTVADNRVVNCGYGPDDDSCAIGIRATTVPVAFERNEIVCGEHGPGQLSKNGIALASANVSVRSNVIAGEVARAGMALTTFADPYFPTHAGTGSNCVIYANNSASLTSGVTQVLVKADCGKNLFANNQYGPLGSAGVAGTQVFGKDNRLVVERFQGAYLGSAQPCIWLTTTSSGNLVANLKYGEPSDLVVCTRVRDEGRDDIVAGIERCNRK